MFTDREIEIPPRLFTIAVFFGALFTLAYGLIFQKWIIACSAMFFPLLGIFLVYSIRHPRLGYAIYATYSYYLIAIIRYSRHDGLSVVLDILLVYILICVLFSSLRKSSDIHFSSAFNVLTIGYSAWMLYILWIFANTPTSQESIIIGTRGWLLGIPMLYILSSLLANKPRVLKNGLILIGIFTITAFLKLLYQKFRWFDAAETEWLAAGSWHTHILSSGIRYFSIFSDAGCFGASMGMLTTIYGIISIRTSKRYLRYFYLCIAVMSCIGMFMSGTRGAIIIPLGGLALYCLISKNLKVMSISASLIFFMYLFFTFTTIGDSNSFIRRMRTAFKPTKDDSFQVRLENQTKIREYILSHPWGAGVGGKISRTMEVDGEFIENDIPPDSFYVDIWSQTGYPGLILYITIYTVVLFRCCYIVMFCVENKELRNTLAALICGVFGIWLNGYVGRGMGMPPNNFLIAAALAFVLNGAYMDKQLAKNK